MRYPKLRALAALLLGAMTALGGGAATAAELAVGDTAPDFTLTGSDGKQHRLADYRGTAVVVAWFPKAFTGG
jgi:peroxiredoxin Q/BCP